jgi:hypothetical protein
VHFEYSSSSDHFDFAEQSAVDFELSVHFVCLDSAQLFQVLYLSLHLKGVKIFLLYCPTLQGVASLSVAHYSGEAVVDQSDKHHFSFFSKFPFETQIFVILSVVSKGCAFVEFDQMVSHY